MTDTKTLGYDPTTDPEIIKLNEELQKQRDQSTADMNFINTTKTPTDLKLDKYDKYGNVAIKPPSRRAPKITGNPIGNI